MTNYYIRKDAHVSFLLITLSPHLRISPPPRHRVLVSPFLAIPVSLHL